MCVIFPDFFVANISSPNVKSDIGAQAGRKKGRPPSRLDIYQGASKFKFKFYQ